MIITTIVLFLLTIGFGYLCSRFDSDSGWASMCVAIAVVLGACFIAQAINTLTLPYDYNSQIAQFNATKETIKQQREMAKTDYERVQLTQEIITNNQWLADIQYKNTTIWGDVIPDVVDKLTPIK